MEHLLATTTVSMTDFKKNPAKVLREAGHEPVAVLSHNKPAFYMVDPVLFEALLDEVEDAQLMPLLKERIERGDFVDVNLNDL
jgi:antitoxin StbD